jgi:hypothetical protein
VVKGYFLQPSTGPEKYGFNRYPFHVWQAGCFRPLRKGAAEREKAPFWDLLEIFLMETSPEFILGARKDKI